MRSTVSFALVALVVVCGGTLMGAGPAGAAPVNTAPPTISGTPEYAARLTADHGSWTPGGTGEVTYAYQWFRGGESIAGADAATYDVVLEDIGHRLRVEVTATDDSGSDSALSAETDQVERAELRAKGGQKVIGVARYTHTLIARSGTWAAQPTRLSYQWLRFGRPIEGATAKRYVIAPGDVGRSLRVEITAKAPGYLATTARSAKTARIGHRVDVRRVVRYSVTTRGAISTSLKAFIAQAQQTLDDPRGWRGAGIEFRRVKRGGSMTLVLAAASTVPSFSSGCSSQWSCRVGRYVIINQDRWKFASPAWNAANGALRDYRHMVVNHETGHFLGLGHASCPGPGRAAPVMMQQSKGLHGCHFNPWPTAGEVAGRTPRG